MTNKLPLHRMDESKALVRAAKVIQAPPGGTLELDIGDDKVAQRSNIAKSGSNPIGKFFVETRDGQSMLMSDEEFAATEVERADLDQAEREWDDNVAASKREAAAKQATTKSSADKSGPKAAQGSQGAPTDKGAPEQPPPNKPAPEAKT